MKSALRMLVFVATLPLLIGHGGGGGCPWDEPYEEPDCTVTKTTRWEIASDCLAGRIKIEHQRCDQAQLHLPGESYPRTASVMEGSEQTLAFDLDTQQCELNLADGTLACQQCVDVALQPEAICVTSCSGTLERVEEVEVIDAGGPEVDAGGPDQVDAGDNDAGPVDGGTDAGEDAGDPVTDAGLQDGGVDAGAPDAGA